MTPSNSLLANQDSSLQICLPNKKPDDVCVGLPRVYTGAFIQSDRNNFPEKLPSIEGEK